MSLRLNTDEAERTAVIDPAQNVAESVADRPLAFKSFGMNTGGESGILSVRFRQLVAKVTGCRK
jgi:hypothetical protein